ncbi:uncharacterized protein RSE6_08373 [Rhynchosporium secalis]|uniref:Uncharacterized protein n=1 Tax=Rhynchosporium secalis TaxID=38038 RepID=A0A1E1MFC2_RHYSE|nr:uncharacterized protein RSE6_08373 [Rhynchosporium secalis]
MPSPRFSPCAALTIRDGIILVGADQAFILRQRARLRGVLSCLLVALGIPSDQSTDALEIGGTNETNLGSDLDADLYALSIVSKRFHFVVERTLYQTIRIVKELRKSHSHPLLLFMRTILVRNDLVSVVRSLELNSHQVVFEHREKGSMFAVPRMQLENEIVVRELEAGTLLVAWIHVEQSQPHNLAGSRHRHAGNVSASGHPRSPLQLLRL